jgi:hypothetical protein
LISDGKELANRREKGHDFRFSPAGEPWPTNPEGPDRRYIWVLDAEL